MRLTRTCSTLACLLLLAANAARAAVLPPSADPVAQFITVADSVARTQGDGGLAVLAGDNGALAGAVVAKLLDTAFQLAQQGDAAGEKEHVDFARRIATAHATTGGTPVAQQLVEAYRGWTPAQRRTRAKAMGIEEQATAARKAGDLAKAIDLLTQARALYEQIGDAHSVAVNWGSMGVARWGTGEWDAVAADYEQALAARRAVEDRILEGRTLNGLGSTYQQKGDWDRAADYYRQAIALRERTGDLSGLGTSMTYLGHVYNNSGRYVEARDQYEKTLPILEQMGNPQQMVEILTGIAAVNSAMGRAADANDAYRRGIELAAQNGLGAHEMLCRRNLADNYRVEGNYDEALDQVGAALQLLAANPDPTEEALMYQTRGVTYLDMGELDAAREDLLRCAELTATLDNPAHAINAQINIGFLYGELGAYDRGLKAADKARELAEAAGAPREYREAVALRASLEQRAGRYDAALAGWEEALAQDQNDGATALALVDETNIASLHAVLGRTGEARTRLRALVPRARAAELAELESSIMLAMGHSFEKENADSAAHYYELALARVEAGGAKIGGAELKTGYLSGKRRYYYEEVARFYAATLAATGDARWSDRAFRTVERAKSRGLLDLMQKSVLQASSPEEDRLLDELYSLDPKSAGYADRRAELEKQYAAQRTARVSGALAGLSAATADAGIDEVARALPKKTVLFEYALGDSASLLWIIDRKGHELRTLPARRQIEAEVRRLRDAIARVDGGEEAMLSSARALYRMLLEPAGERLAKAEALIIVPDGGLFELPFDALLAADPVAGTAMGAQPFLARTHATTYTPSAAVYLRLRAGEEDRKYARDLFAVGNPDFAALAPRGSAPLEALPFAEAEVQAIGSRVKETRRVTLVGAAATESAVKREIRADSPRVIHLATHGLVDASDPARSSVALAAGEGEDGYFHTLEIISTPTTSGLVVMSACESARGRVSRGEGVVGLSRAFLAAGAESVVASLWSVSDESTAELMRVFYDRMFGDKRTASRALSDARIALIEGGKFSHPFFWSPFIVTGTERSPW